MASPIASPTTSAPYVAPPQTPIEEVFPESGTTLPPLDQSDTILRLEHVLELFQQPYYHSDQYSLKQLFQFTGSILAELTDTGQQLQQTQPDQYQRLQQTIARAQFLVLGMLSPDRVTTLFERFFQYFFQHPWTTIADQVRHVLMFEPVLEQRDIWKKTWSDAIARSTAPLGQGMITVNDELLSATVEHWLMDWKQFLGDRTSNPLLITEYLNTRPIIQQADSVVKKEVEGLLRFLYMLSLSSLTATGTEEQFVFPDPTSGTYKIFDHGEVVDTMVAVEPETLIFVRRSYGLDEHGKPLPLSERIVDGLVATNTVSRYQAPVGSEAPAEVVPTVEVDQQPLPSAFPAAAPVPSVVRATVDDQIRTEIESLQSAPTPLSPPQPAATAAAPLSEFAASPLPTPTPTPVSSQPQVVPPVQSPVAAPVPLPPVMSTPRPTLPPTTDWQHLSELVLSRHNLLFPSADIERRFLSIVSSYLRGTSSASETTAALTAPTDSQGVNLSAEIAAGILESCAAVQQEALEHPGQLAKTASVTSSSAQRPTLAAALQQVAASQPTPVTPASDSALPNEPLVEDVFAQFDDGATLSVPTAMPTPTALPPQMSVPPTSHGRQVLGPIDELRQMTVEEFRRLAMTPAQTTEKIIQKIQLLEQESLTQKAAGIAAWKASPVNQLYIELGNASLAAGQSVKQVIASRTTSNQPTLTDAEFGAIADLNRQLRY